MPDARQMNDFERAISAEIYNAIQEASNTTDRSLQQQDFRLGMSNIGHCRQYALLMMKQTEPSDVTDKTAAFIGTVLGAAIEAQLKKRHPDWLFQSETNLVIPSGGNLPSHPDIIIPASAATEEFPQGVLDLKSKAELDTIRFYGQSLQQKFQLHGYAQGAIDKELFDLDKPIMLADVFFDRSGRVHECYSISEVFDPSVIEDIDEWIKDVKYAAIHGEDAPRDMPRDWCYNWCEYATTCRGADTDVEGLIEDESVVAAVNTYAKGAELVREGERLKKSAKDVIKEGVSGSTGEYNVRWTEIGESNIAFTRAAYKKLDIRPVPKPKALRKKKEPSA